MGCKKEVYERSVKGVCERVYERMYKEDVREDVRDCV